VIKVYYVPKDNPIEDYLFIAKEEECRQLVHGPSNLTDEFVEDVNKPGIVYIPEDRFISVVDTVSEVGNPVYIYYINEFLRTEGLPWISFKIKKIDPDFPKVKHEIANIVPDFDGYFTFETQYTFNEIGEYVVEVYQRETKESEDLELILKEEIIIFEKQKQQEEENLEPLIEL